MADALLSDLVLWNLQQKCKITGILLCIFLNKNENSDQMIFCFLICNSYQILFLSLRNMKKWISHKFSLIFLSQASQYVAVFLTLCLLQKVENWNVQYQICLYSKILLTPKIQIKSKKSIVYCSVKIRNISGLINSWFDIILKNKRKIKNNFWITRIN